MSGKPTAEKSKKYGYYFFIKREKELNCLLNAIVFFIKVRLSRGLFFECGGWQAIKGGFYTDRFGGELREKDTVNRREPGALNAFIAIHGRKKRFTRFPRFFFTGIGTVNGRQLIIYYIRLMLLKDTVDVVVVAASSAPRQSGDGSRTSDAAFVTCVVG